MAARNPKCEGATYEQTPSRVCGAPTAAGHPCRLRTIKYGERCWIHTMHKEHLKVQKSRIPGAGDGLFAWNPKGGRGPVFSPGDVIELYTGEVTTTSQLTRDCGRDVTAKYAVVADDNTRPRTVVNAWKKNDEVTRYANDPRNPALWNAHLEGLGRTRDPARHLR